VSLEEEVKRLVRKVISEHPPAYPEMQEEIEEELTEWFKKSPLVNMVVEQNKANRLYYELKWKMEELKNRIASTLRPFEIVVFYGKGDKVFVGSKLDARKITDREVSKIARKLMERGAEWVWFLGWKRPYERRFGEIE